MLPLSKILIPIDFSDRCAQAATYALALAEHFHSIITLLHISARHPAEANGQHIAEAQAGLKDFLRGESNHVNVQRELRFGDPATEIVAYAQSQQPDLIMMPTHGYGEFRRRLLGSVTMKVLHDVDCPVWTGAHLSAWLPTESILPKVILCAIDVNRSGEEILAWASEFASSFNAQMEIVYAEPRFESFGEEYYSGNFYFRIMTAAKQKLEEMRRRAGAQGEIHIEPGDIPHAVVETAERRHADLVVIGRGSKTACGRLGLNTYGIIRSSRCPLISVPC
ncbi:MAG: universal stress protein [Bryobacteraceae bacterium]